MLRLAMIIAAACAALIVPPVTAHEYKLGALKIGHPWARATPKGAPVGAGYLTITNTGSAPDRLIGGAVAFAKHLEIHEMKMDNGIMKMRMLPNGLTIKPGQTVMLQPGGYHVMFTGLKKPLVKGEHVDATLKFEKAGEVKVYFVVEGIGAMNGGGKDMKGTSMPMGK
jgi:copper(I)-binding protein